MLTKLLFTAAIIAIVITVLRMKSASRQSESARSPDEDALSARAVAYGIVVVLILFSAAVFIFRYQSGGEIISFGAIFKDGALHRGEDIKARQAAMPDDRRFTLTEHDRVETDDR